MTRHPPDEFDNEDDRCLDCTRTDCITCAIQTGTERMLAFNALEDISHALPDLAPIGVDNDDDEGEDDEEEDEPVILDITPLDTPVSSPPQRRTHKPKLQTDPPTPKRGKGRPKKEADPSIPKRKPGGQPGNLNAIRHGLYVQGNAIHNTNPIDRARLFDLNHAIQYLKDYLETTYRNGKKLKITGEINDTLRALSLASLAITRLIDTHHQHEVSSLPSELRSSRTTSLEKIMKHFDKTAIFIDDDPDPSTSEALNGESF